MFVHVVDSCVGLSRGRHHLCNVFHCAFGHGADSCGTSGQNSLKKNNSNCIQMYYRIAVCSTVILLKKSNTSDLLGYVSGEAELRNGGYSHARRTEWAKKLVRERPKIKLAESQFKKKSNCHAIKMN